ncbi:MAG: cytochrome P460 family protein [bacterium]
MKPTIIALFLLSTSAFAVEPAPNGIAFPEGYQDWSVLSVSHRVDNHTMRVILGNDVAIKAARNGKTLPWPDGAIIGKVVWKEMAEKSWPSAIAPNQFVHAEFMFKDNVKWPEQDGWGYARWKGENLKPYGHDENFKQECIACHTPVKKNDWVFTTPAHIAFPH